MAKLYRQAEVIAFAKLSQREQKWLKEDIAAGSGSVLDRFTKETIRIAEDMEQSKCIVDPVVRELCKIACSKK